MVSGQDLALVWVLVLVLVSESELNLESKGGEGAVVFLAALLLRQRAKGAKGFRNCCAVWFLATEDSTEGEEGLEALGRWRHRRQTNN